ncbi:MAG TPA: MBL fold metallo-hydrolase [Burkholderiaceae bacterium]|nr:MBL fold metallo-hydrolase [Burkholderiaceae bacterium]
MKTISRRLVVAAAVLAASCAQVPLASQATVAGHVADAERFAGDDLKPLLALCKPAPATRPSQEQVDKLLATQIARPAPEPGRAFDNLYFVGAAWVSAWVIKTSEGLILIDALNNDDEAKRLVDSGMRRLGLDPAEIRYVIVTHAHGDHYGGLPYLSARYQPRIVMSEDDWEQAEGTLEFDSPLWGRPPKFDPARDVKARDGDELVLGDTAVAIHTTPGHTHGTVSLVFDVTQGGQTHRALLWGGTAFNFGKDLPRLQSYIDATGKMTRIAQRQDIDVMISNHAGYDSAPQKLDALRTGATANPFVIGEEAVIRSLKTMGACARAQYDRFALGI